MDDWSFKIHAVCRGASMLSYPAALPLSRQTLTCVAAIIRRHRAKIGSPWRKLNPAQQALLVLAYLHKGETFAELAAGLGIGTATAWRYVTEMVGLLAARSPRLRSLPRRSSKSPFVAPADSTRPIPPRNGKPLQGIAPIGPELHMPHW